MERPHVLLVAFPAQGHINPSLQFAKKLTSIGIDVTFPTTIYARRCMARAAAGAAAVKGVTFATFSDGYDDEVRPRDDSAGYITELRNLGIKALKEIIVDSAEQGRPVRCLVYSLLLPWAMEVARELQVPSALLWIQPASVLDAYYYYFNGFEKEIRENCNDPNWSVQFPGTSIIFGKLDLPSFMLPSCSDAYSFVLGLFRDQIKVLDEEIKPKILVNTFDALESDALKSIPKYELIGIGPLIPSAFLDGKDPSDRSFGGDLFQKPSDDYKEWLDSKPNAAVVYVSFGSLLKLPRAQMEEIARGLLDCGRPFLWVIRTIENESKTEDEELGCIEELEKIGKIVPWCSQLDVLKHPSVGCFVTHCGWNSTLESLSCGVPMVAFPHWTDQGTNAKLITDVWRAGVRVKNDENGAIRGAEIRLRIDELMGESGRELRENAKKWRSLATEAVQEDGSSHKNLKAFLGEIGLEKFVS